MPYTGFKSATLSETVLKRLMEFKKESKARSIDQAIEFLLDRVEVASR